MRSVLRIAATGDIHCSAGDGERIRSTLERVERDADLVLLAGDLTQHGQLEEAQALADACRGFGLPIVAVLGNHDWHSDRAVELTAALTDAGVIVLERGATILSVDGTTVGVAGVKGFVGGFGAQWANFGEPLFRQAYAETTEDVEALDRALEQIAACAVRVALLHYAPISATLEGEPERLWLVLGAERLATPIREHRPHLVLHGHAHHGTFAGELDGIPVHNVAVHVTGKDFEIFTLDV